MIKLICVDKVKEKYLEDGIKEYLKRINKYIKFEIIETKDERIINFIKEKDFVVCLDILGNEIDSVKFSSFLENQLIINSNIVFVIGGSNGIEEEVLKRSNYNLSFSKMTFPNQLFRLVFLEQLYRCFKIINNETYHK
jgi:23S rRNA (pseudouridine1915-N3)-methyltransferase